MPEDRSDEKLEASTRKWMVAGLVLMALFVLAFPVFRVYEPARRADARESQLSYEADVGAGLFLNSCAECHGPRGSGAFGPAIGSKEFLESVDDDQIARLTAVGVPGTEMVAYSNDYGGPMTASDIRSVVTYLRSLEEDAPSIPGWRSPLESSDFTPSQLFSLACSRCHGVDRMGIEGVAPDISATSLTMMESDQWIFDRISGGYKLMPRFSRVLSDAQIASIVTYLKYGDNPPPPETTTTTTVPGSTTDTTTPSTTDTTVAASPATDDVLALGEVIFQQKFNGEGCQACHGPTGTGTPSGPNITGASRSTVTGALQEVPDMDVEPKLTNDEIEAVYAYLRWLVEQSIAAG